MLLAPIVGPHTYRMPSRHAVSMVSNGLYTRPVMCKICDEIFDFPTLTTDITEKDKPVKTRICRDCLWKIGCEVDLREARARAEEANRRIVALLERDLTVVNGHKSSLSSISTNETSGTDADTAPISSTSHYQGYYVFVPLPRTPQERTENRPSSGGRRLSNVRDMLN